MTPKEFEKQMLEIYKETDYEIRHQKADVLICKVLKELGYSSGVEVFKDMEKWYA